MDHDSAASFWTARAQALARAQDRYLLILALAGLFFYALDIRVSSSRDALTSLRLPLVDIDLSALIVWAAAPIVIGFLLLAVLGAFHALRDAHSHLRAWTPAGSAADPLHDAPEITFNLLDAVVYISPSSPKTLQRLAGLTYPLVLTAFWIEAATFLGEVIARPASDLFAAGDYPIWRLVSANAFRLLGLAVVLAPLPRLGSFWRLRLRKGNARSG